MRKLSSSRHQHRLYPIHNPGSIHFPLTYSPGHFPLTDNSSSIFTWCRIFPPFHHHHPTINNIKRSTVKLSRLGPGVLVSASFQFFCLYYSRGKCPRMWGKLSGRGKTTGGGMSEGKCSLNTRIASHHLSTADGRGLSNLYELFPCRCYSPSRLLNQPNARLPPSTETHHINPINVPSVTFNAKPKESSGPERNAIRTKMILFLTGSFILAWQYGIVGFNVPLDTI